MKKKNIKRHGLLASVVITLVFASMAVALPSFAESYLFDSLADKVFLTNAKPQTYFNSTGAENAKSSVDSELAPPTPVQPLLAATQTCGVLDDFNRADSTNMGANWTEATGDFSILGNRAVGTNGSAMSFTGATSGDKACVEVYAAASGVQYGGVYLKWTSDSNNLFVKVQDNDGNGSFDRIFLLQNGGFTYNQACQSGFGISSPFTSARLNVYLDGTTLKADIDTNFDNTPDQSYSCAGAPSKSGTGVALGIFGGTALDNFGIPPSTLTVTKTADTNDGACDADCSLREAIAAAASGDTINFASPLFDSPQTISLTLGELSISGKTLSITGKDARLTTVSGNNASRIFNIFSNSNVSISNLTITNGNASIGGGVALNGAIASLSKTIISNSTAANGGGIYSCGNLTVTDSTIIGNTASDGGGILIFGSTNCNSVTNVYMVVNTTISGNTATGTIGATGGVNSSGAGTIINSTITGNSASTTAIAAAGGFRRNGGTPNIRNTIISGNTGNSPDVNGTFTDQGNNLVGSFASVRLAPLGYYGGQTPTHALLSGSTAINAGNNCVTDLSCPANNPSFALTADQRGASRVGAVDIGAFELNNSANGGNYRGVLPGGRQGAAYNYTIISNVGSVTNFSVSGGSLPGGVSINTAANAFGLSGTPTANGNFLFSITASDGANSVVTDYSLEILPPLDNTPPDTTITGNPPLFSNSASASFTFTGSDDTTPAVNLTFECRLDGVTFTACASPQNYINLSDSSHTFEVRAIDAAGNADPTPASYTWTIDKFAPDTTITATPANQTSDANASFIFTGTDNISAPANLMFECSLDNAAFTSCGSPQIYSGLSLGTHNFRVRAADEAGNIDPTPASYDWTITALPTLGNYQDAGIDLSGNTTVSPDAAPTGTIFAAASTSSDFKGNLTVDPSTGIVSVTNAHPAGTYAVTVRAFGLSGAAVTETFNLTVTTPAGCASFGASSFTRMNYAVGNAPQSVAVGDFNGDGRQDVVAGNVLSNNVSVLFRNSAGDGFEPKVDYPVGLRPVSVAVGDINGDGRQDIVVGNYNSSFVSILFRNAANDGFESAVNLTLADGVNEIAVGDLNGDGRADIAAAIKSSTQISVFYRNAGNTGFDPRVDLTAAASSNNGLTIADFNGDGRADLAAASPLNAFSVFFRSAANDGFQSAVSVFLPANNAQSITAGDFNGDGRQDFAVSYVNSGYVSVHLRNAANDGFESAITLSGVGPFGKSPVAGDFNNDGKQDIAAVGLTNNILLVWLRNAANTGFDSAVVFSAPNNPAWLAVGDFNGDNRQDLVTANQNDNSISVFERVCDSTPPVITPTITGTLGSNGWYVSDVQVSWSVVDDESLISSQTGCDTQTVMTDTNAVTYICSATSAGGTDSSSVTIKRDATAPTITFASRTAPNSNGWNNSNVAVEWTCADNLSGAASSSVTTIISTEGANQTVLGICTDNAGNTAQNTQTEINIDKSAPTITFDSRTVPNANGWNNTNVSVNWTCADTLSGAVNSTVSQTVSSEGVNLSSTGTCSDLAGNSAQNTQTDIKIDKTAPTITFVNRTAPNATGWNNTDVSVNWTCADTLSGAASAGVNQLLTAEGIGQSATGTCFDLAGNSASNTQTGIKIDKTAPSITFANRTAPNANGWNNTNVSVNWNCADALSGAVSSNVNQILTTEGSSQSAIGTCVDLAGNSASNTQSGIRIDKTAPTLAPVVSPNPVQLNGAAMAAANAADALSGIASQSCGAVVTSSVGFKSVLCTATDLAGNSNSANANYQVVYNFSGFFSPVQNLPTTNLVTAGSIVDIYFSLAGNQGLNVIAAGYPASSPVACNADIPGVSSEQTVGFGRNAFTYSSVNNRYRYQWLTNYSWAGTCRMFVLKLTDGSEHYAKFQFQ